MKQLTTSDRLKQIMSERNLKQVDILEACKPFCAKYSVSLKKNDLSQYVSGKVEPRQDKLSILGMALGVNEVWLMGYDVPAGKDELAQLASSAPTRTYSQSTQDAVELFEQLDVLDQGKIIGKMEDMLEADKYKAKEASCG